MICLVPLTKFIGELRIKLSKSCESGSVELHSSGFQVQYSPNPINLSSFYFIFHVVFHLTLHY